MEKKVCKGFEGTAKFERIRDKMSMAYIDQKYALAMKYSKQLDDLMNEESHLKLVLPKEYISKEAVIEKKQSSHTPPGNVLPELCMIAK